MENLTDSANELSNLRQRAEMQLQPTGTASPLSEAESQKLLHELQVHQIELEMQNEQLHESLSATELDITELRLTEAKLNENQKFLNEVQMNAMHGTFSIDLTKARWTSSEVLDLIFGIDADFDKSAESWVSIIHPEWRQVMRDYFNQEIKTKKRKFDKEYQIIRQNNQEKRWVHSIARLEFNENDKPVRIVGIINDITDRKNAEVALRESEIRFRKLLQDVQSVSVQGYAPDGTTQYWNQASERLYGYTAKEAIGNNLVDLIIPPDMRLDVKQAIRQMAETGLPIPSSELSLMHKDGSMVSVFSSHTIVQVPGQPQELFCIDIDLTERKKAEQALKDSEIKYRELIENLPDAIGIYVEGKIVLVNKECLHLLAATSADELIGKPVIQFVHPDYRVIVQERMQKSAHEDVILPLTEEKFIRLDGSFVDVEVKAMPIRFGNKSGVQLIVRDITERKRAEEAQRQSQVFLNSIIENSPNMLWISDENGTLLRMNQACRDHLHIQDKEVVGIYNILNDNLIKEQGLIPLVKDVFEKGATVRFETSYDTAVIKNLKLEKTTKIILDVNISPILNLQGKVTNAIIQEIDITERKQAEVALRKSKQQYDDLVSKIPVGVYILHTKPDGAFALDYASPRMAQMLNLSVEDLLANNETIFKAIHPDDLDGFRTLSQDGIFQHRPFNWKGRIVADGNIKWMHFRSTPEMLGNGDTLWHGLINDITERVNAEQEISLKNEELSNLVAEKDRFFSIVAHDLRSPFNALLGVTQLLDDDLPNMKPDEAHRMVSSLKRSALSVYNLLENLLEWSRITRGNTSFDPESIILQTKIDEFLQPVLESANKKRIEISYIVPDELVVFADLHMMGSIIRNLASNAVKFTPKNGKVILVAHAIGDQSIEISIKDTGIGMNKSILKKLFNIDRNNNRRGTDGESSSGLGLIICKEFVEKHGGRIWAESEEGKGSTFYFTLPAK